jgi:hypothetical protein
MTLINSDFFLVNRSGTDFKVQYSDLEASIVGAVDAPGNGKITINQADGTAVGSFTVNQDGDTQIALPQVVIPEALNPLGFIDVSNTAPLNPTHGDLYIQHRKDEEDGVADPTFTGLSGRAVAQGQFVVFGKDNVWHAGGQAAPTEVQADYAQADITARDYIKNKPDIQGLIDSSLQNPSNVGDGKLTLKNADGSTAGSFSANQSADETIQLPAGFSGKYTDLTGIPTEFTPEAHTHDYNSLVNKPTIGEGVLTINQAGKKVGEFTANQTGNVTIELLDTDTNIDAYTKAESDARFIAKDISKLPTLN